MHIAHSCSFRDMEISQSFPHADMTPCFLVFATDDAQCNHVSLTSIKTPKSAFHDLSLDITTYNFTFIVFKVQE